jgi:malonyl CoA-acyl carrier protein transacylase
VRAARAAGAGRGIEVGPGLVLTGLVQKIDAGLAMTSVPNADALAALPAGRIA